MKHQLTQLLDDLGLPRHYHIHVCPNCGLGWAHGGLDTDPHVSEEQYDAAHRCPNCHTEQREWFHDETRRPVCVFDGRRVVRLPRSGRAT